MDSAVKLAASLGIMLAVTGVVFSLFGGWNQRVQALWDASADTMQTKQLHINQKLLQHAFPQILAENQRVQQNSSFSIQEHVRAIDHQDGDISERLKFYGEVQTDKKGVYTIRCVVRNSLGMKTVKHVMVLVD